jgi:hypothetical protein
LINHGLQGRRRHSIPRSWPKTDRKFRNFDWFGALRRESISANCAGSVMHSCSESHFPEARENPFRFTIWFELNTFLTCLHGCGSRCKWQNCWICTLSWFISGTLVWFGQLSISFSLGMLLFPVSTSDRTSTI